jgi:hypothetical protein
MVENKKAPIQAGDVPAKMDAFVPPRELESVRACFSVAGRRRPANHSVPRTGIGSLSRAARHRAA